MKSLLTFITLLILAGCASTPAPAVSYNQEPSWVLNPNQDGKNGAIGVAGRTYDQKVSTQRKLAITRALDELTLQRGVKVSLTMDKHEKVSNDRSSLDLEEQSNYAASANITAHIEKVWKNKLSNEIYIWMVLD